MTRATACIFAGLVCAAGCVDTNWIDPMERQKRFEPYSENAFFADERAMRPLVEGTIAREQALGPAVLISGLDGDHYATRIPMPITAAVLARGQQRFNITCAACHGVAGNGHSVVASKMSLRPPPSLVDAPVADYPPGRVYQVVSLGYGLMASYATELSIEDRWAIVAYWEALKLSHDSPLTSATPLARQRLEAEHRAPEKNK